jgi:hypothetical protein
MGELTGDRREGDGERRGAGGTAVGRRKGGKGTTYIDNASDTTSSALSRIFYLIKAVNLRGIK